MPKAKAPQVAHVIQRYEDEFRQLLADFLEDLARELASSGVVPEAIKLLVYFILVGWLEEQKLWLRDRFSAEFRHAARPAGVV